MEDDDDPEALARLRRVAYSRDGTADDREKLAVAEARQATGSIEQPGVPEPVAPPEAEAEPEPEPDAEAAPQSEQSEESLEAPRRRRPLVLALLLVGAAAVGWAGAWTVFQVTQQPSSLQVFEQPGTASDSPQAVRRMGRIQLSGGTQFGEIRLVATVDEGKLYAVQGIDIQSSGETSPVICLALVGNPDSGSSASRVGHFECSSLKRFLLRGASVGSYAHAPDEWVWGPTGDGVHLSDR